MSVRRCVRCGNPIPEWANGVCFACKKLQRPWIRRSSKFLRHRPERRRNFVPEDISIAARTKGIALIAPFSVPVCSQSNTQSVPRLNIRPSEWRRLARDYLNRVNVLLKDIYGQETRISDLLSKSDIPQGELKSWRKKYFRIYSYLCQFEDGLYELLKQECPNCNSSILRDRYIEHLSVQRIARKSNSRVCDILNTLESLLAYLRSEAGRIALEQVLVKAYRKLAVDQRTH